MIKNKKYNVVEIFSGVGAPRMALKQLGVNINEVFISEWNIHSVIAYASIHETEKYIRNKTEIIESLWDVQDLENWLYVNYTNNDKQPILSNDGKKPLAKYTGMKYNLLVNLVAALKSLNNKGDVSQIDGREYNGEVDIFWHSSPCQAFSMAGNSDGGDKDSGTTSSLLWESFRLVKEINPNIVIWENVAGAVADKHIHNFNNYLDEMTLLGYKNSHIIIDGVTLGFPQLRKRVFAVSVKGESEIDLSNIINNNYNKVNIEDLININEVSYISPGVKNVFYRNVKGAKYHNALKNVNNSTLTETEKEEFKKLFSEWSNGYSKWSTDIIKPNYEKYLEQCGDTVNILEERIETLMLKIELVDFFFDSNMSPSRMAKSTEGYIGTLTCTQRMSKYSCQNNEASVLNDLEYWKLMGFLTTDLKKVVNEVNNKEIFKICGNSVLLPQAEALFKEIFSQWK